jgi:hypothetical protein
MRITARIYIEGINRQAAAKGRMKSRNNDSEELLCFPTLIDSILLDLVPIIIELSYGVIFWIEFKKVRSLSWYLY